MSAASNIKDKENRKAVLDTLKTIQHRLRTIKKVPESGIGIFTGWYL